MNSIQWKMVVPVVLLFAPGTVFAGSQTFTSSGTFTVPSYATLTVTLWGAGGGGAGNTVSGNAGGSSTFDTVTATGGGGGTGPYPYSGGSGGSGSGGDTNSSGSTGGSALSGWCYGGAGASPGGGSGGSNSCAGPDGSAPGGGGGGNVSSPGESWAAGGGGGGRAQKTYSSGALTPGAVISVTVGTGGAGGSSGVVGGSGARGEVQITWNVAPSVEFTKTVTVRKNLAVTDSLSKGSGSFVIDHPLDPKNKLLYHSFVESPDVKNIYDGVATLDDNGEAQIQLPDYFMALNKDYRYVFSPLYQPMPNLYIKNGIEENHFTVAGGVSGGTITWQVTGIRHDPYILANPIIPEVEKGPDQLVDKGEYLFPEYYSRGSLTALWRVWELIRSFF